MMESQRREIGREISIATLKMLIFILDLTISYITISYYSMKQKQTWWRCGIILILTSAVGAAGEELEQRVLAGRDLPAGPGHLRDYRVVA